MEEWADIRRLHRSETVPIKEIARRLEISRNTVRAVLASERPPRYERSSRHSVVDRFEPQIRKLLIEWPKMPAPMIAERIERPHSLSVVKKRLQMIRPKFVGHEPDDRTVYRPGEILQCDLWFPETLIPVGGVSVDRILPVLVMSLGYS